MSTRSRIGYVDQKVNKNVATTCYIHHDGYPSFVGRMLKLYYNDPEKVKELVAAGDRHEKFLWAGNLKNHIKTMKDIWNSLKVKPEWLTMEQIEAWEKEMEG